MFVLCEKVPIQITNFEVPSWGGDGGAGGNESEICTHPHILYHLIKS